jgi:hypothetical protein
VTCSTNWRARLLTTEAHRNRLMLRRSLHKQARCISSGIGPFLVLQDTVLMRLLPCDVVHLPFHQLDLRRLHLKFCLAVSIVCLSSGRLSSGRLPAHFVCFQPDAMLRHLVLQAQCLIGSSCLLACLLPREFPFCRIVSLMAKV